MSQIISLNDYDGKQKKTDSVLALASVFLCVISIIALIISFVFIDKENNKFNDVIPSFESALESCNYSEALQIYRDVQADVASDSDKSGRDYETRLSLMTTMEELVKTRVESIEERIRYERYEPSANDAAFLDGMGELSGSLISDWLTSLCDEFLLGTIEKPVITFIFEQVEPLKNISATAAPLLKEIDNIEMACGSAQEAEKDYNDGEYIEAVQLYSQIADSYEGFVNTFANERVAEIKEVMYQPMLEEGEHMLDTFKYYSAEELLSGLAAIFPDDERINSDLLEATSHTVPVEEYNGQVEVLSIRGIIADEDTAFSSNYYGSKADLFLTASEFTSILNQLYANDYVLVDAEALVGITDPTYLSEQDLYVPEGKKPLIIIIEQLDYIAENYGAGICRRLVLNDQGQVCAEFSDSEGQLTTTRNAEAIGILDSFVEDHPDFSYNGVKGVISVCGYESVFGYVISDDETDDRTAALTSAGFPNETFTEAEIESNRNTVMAISEALLDTGWKFASSTYGNINAEASDMNVITDDTTKWMEQVEPLLGGDVHMIVYPGGNFINGTDTRAEYLKNLGFRIFFGIGSRPYYTYGINYLYYDRTPVSGASLRSTDFSSLFDVTSVYDVSRPESLTEME